MSKLEKRVDELEIASGAGLAPITEIHLVGVAPGRDGQPPRETCRSVLTFGSVGKHFRSLTRSDTEVVGPQEQEPNE